MSDEEEHTFDDMRPPQSLAQLERLTYERFMSLSNRMEGLQKTVNEQVIPRLDTMNGRGNRHEEWIQKREIALAEEKGKRLGRAEAKGEQIAFNTRTVGAITALAALVSFLWNVAPDILRLLGEHA